MLRSQTVLENLSGLVVVSSTAFLNPLFVFSDLTNLALKKGEHVILACTSSSLDSFRVACNKHSINLNSPKFHFLDIPVSEFETPISDLLIKTFESLLKTLDDAKCLVLLDNIEALAGFKVVDQLKFLRHLISVLPVDSSLVYINTDKDLPIRHDALIELTPVGSSFGKKVNGELSISKFSNPLSTRPVSTTWHYCVGERSVQYFHSGHADIL